VKTASEMTYTVSGGVLNSAQSKCQSPRFPDRRDQWSFARLVRDRVHLCMVEGNGRVLVE